MLKGDRLTNVCWRLDELLDLLSKLLMVTADEIGGVVIRNNNNSQDKI